MGSWHLEPKKWSAKNIPDLVKVFGNADPAKKKEKYLKLKTMCHMGVSKNFGTPKWMVYNGKPH